MKKKLCVIIGAGPVGCYAASLLADRGYAVEIYEEHNIIGMPFQCTGILTSSYKNLLDLPDDVIINRIKNVNLVSPSGKKLALKLSNEEIILDRIRFDQHLASLAIKKGVKIFTSHRFVKMKDGSAKIIDIRNLKILTVDADFFIGADGPNSVMRKILNPKRNIRNYIGIQATVKMKHDNDSYDVLVGKNFPRFFGWIVPDGKGVRIGTAARKDTHEVFSRFSRKMKIHPKAKELQGGLIPIYEPKLKVKKGNMMIIGDAATHVKATTGGGIIPGLHGAKEIVEHINGRKTLRNNDLEIHKELRVHLFVRKMLDTFSDKDYERAISLCSQKKIKSIIEDQSRDRMSSFFMKVMMKEPRFAIYGKNLVKMTIRRKE